MFENMNESVFRDKISGCWLGKGIGGTLGMPYEGYPHPLALSAEDLSPIQVPNDDLELQLLWIFLLEKHGSTLRADTFISAWNDHFDCNPDEYGIARWNIQRGLKPPLTGLHNNWFTDGMGAAIRSEIWACLFPGQPDLASAFAHEDAIVDHHNNGVFAEMFLAAAESSAFFCDDPIEAIETGLNYIPEDSKVSQSVRYALQLYAKGVPLKNTRPLIMERFGSHNFTDVNMNLAFITLGLAYGSGDFEKTVLTAVNYGMDTDCTGATTAAFMGILMGDKGIPALWKEAAGNELIVSDFLKDLPLPATVDDAANRTLALSIRLNSELAGKVPVDMTPDIN
nr:ADP-ribosylglycohydrolase family protein [PVC group bacterium]